ncbi:MAG TPA: tetratricopeptide repeat protein, partial [Pseudobdellovibrionaceae bacterium]|nr:tetratricopeptide repeat protein [Pseudobdellovibrionaceae bacterium]
MKQIASLITILALLSQLMGCTTTEENKHKADLYVRLGAANLDSGKYALALKHFLQAESLDSENPVIQNNLGLTYFLRERFDLALVHFQKAVKVSPQFTDARNNLARTLVETGRYAEVRALCAEFAKRYPAAVRCRQFGVTPEGRPLRPKSRCEP